MVTNGSAHRSSRASPSSSRVPACHCGALRARSWRVRVTHQGAKWSLPSVMKAVISAKKLRSPFSGWRRISASTQSPCRKARSSPRAGRQPMASFNSE
ncbi:hypothetical protein N4G58_04865 [Edwardsiella piscicida]|nr:hypothetical protein N4G58_04865 [Edwardsiella piscicida]